MKEVWTEKRAVLILVAVRLLPLAGWAQEKPLDEELCVSIRDDFGVAGLTGISLHIGLDPDAELTDPIAVSLAYQRQREAQVAELEAMLGAQRATY